MCKCELTEFLAELTEFAAELSEFSPPKQYSRNSIPPDSYDWHAGSPIGQCNGVQSYPQDTRRKIHSHQVLRTWGPASYVCLEGASPMAEISDSVGEFLAIFLPPRAQTDMPSQGMVSCLRCVFASAFCCHKSFWDAF